ncbi:condensation domain-containing protein [Saccharopolyspora sp. CA-218241]|uniref:condensation domain-containing protein n=1 Tax=Saccharopolyspora sp. CA-218241 TaxID=3240027 RepID=UPI003D97D27F
MTESAAQARPLSAAQSGIWFAQQLDRANPVFNTGEYVEIDGPVDPEVFSAALRRVVAEVDAMRMRVVEAAQPQQVIDPPADDELPVLDLTAEADPHAAALAWMRADMDTPADPAEPGRLRSAALLRTGAERWLWYQRIHHVAIDGYGFSIILRRVAEVYTALLAGDDPGRARSSAPKPCWPRRPPTASPRSSSATASSGASASPTGPR